jgi:L-asparagine oxygenase
MVGELVRGGMPPEGAPRPLNDVTITLSDAEREVLRTQLAEHAQAYSDRPLDDEDLLADAEDAGRLLPDRIYPALRRFRRQTSGPGALLVRNMPTDTRLCATPQDGTLGHWSELPVATYAQLAAASAVGDVIAYADEKSGNLIQDIVPLRGERERQENSGTVYLELHTENGFHPHKPDFITLLCLRPDHEREGITVVAGVAEALPRLADQCVAMLRRPMFRLQVSSSFREGSQLSIGPLAVLTGPAEAPELLADFHAMSPMTAEAGAALDEMKAAILAVLRGATLDTGDLLVINNRTAVHGRTSFSARYDADERWLRRCFAVADIRRSRDVRASGSRVCRPLVFSGLSDPA